MLNLLKKTIMKRLIFVISALCVLCPLFAQNKLNDSADSIVGTYFAVQSGENSKVKISKNSDGSYKCQVIWVENDMVNGAKLLDPKNPDKSLRNVPCDKIVLFNGLKYNAEKKQWDGAKIYDPTRGIKANATALFQADGRLCIKGTVLGIGEKVYWKKLD